MRAISTLTPSRPDVRTFNFLVDCKTIHCLVLFCFVIYLLAVTGKIKVRRIN